jgi:hypothetical protein
VPQGELQRRSVINLARETRYDDGPFIRATAPSTDGVPLQHWWPGLIAGLVKSEVNVPVLEPHKKDMGAI